MLRIHIMDLRKGMYVIDRSLLGLRSDPRVYALEGFVLSDDEGPSLRAKGFTTAYIDERYSPELMGTCDPDDTDSEYISPAPDYGLPTVPVPEELANALKARDRTLEYARELARKAALGSHFVLDDINDMFEPVLESLERNHNALLCLSLLQTKDDYTFAHGVDVAVFATMLGRQLGVDPHYLRELSLAGFLHDIGKLFVPQKILHYPGRLNDAQFQSLRRHAELGKKYLASQSGIPDFVIAGTLDHHERYDGTGYPNGKKGKEISLSGRILAVVDVYDALSSQRCYRKAMTSFQSLKQLYATREQDFAPGYMEAFVSAVGLYPPGSLVELTDKSHAVVIEPTTDNQRPKVVILTNEQGRPIQPRHVNLGAEGSRAVTQAIYRLQYKINIPEAISRAE